MSTDISIRVPKVIATPAEFAEWEGIPAALFIK
jgi:hypothetical protein